MIQTILLIVIAALSFIWFTAVATLYNCYLENKLLAEGDYYDNNVHNLPRR